MVARRFLMFVLALMLGTAGFADDVAPGKPAEDIASSAPTLESGDYELRLIISEMSGDKEDTRLPAKVQVRGTELAIETEGGAGNHISIKGNIQAGEVRASFSGEEDGQQMTFRFLGKVTRPNSANGTLACEINGKPAFSGKWLLSLSEPPKEYPEYTFTPDESLVVWLEGAFRREGGATEQFPPADKLRRVPADYKTIQEAIDAAAAGDTVLVSDGTYSGSGNKNLDFKGKAITVRSENGPGKCIIECGGKARAFHFHSGEAKESIVSGFTIRNGQGADLGREWAGFEPTVGGAILCDGSGPTIENNLLFRNSAALGGAIACFQADGILVRRNRIAQNKASDVHGGAIFLEETKSALIQDNFIERNRAKGAGGGMAIFNGSSGLVERNRILENRAESAGGLDVSSSTPVIRNNLIARNESTGTRNGPYLFSGGGAMTLWYAPVQVVNNTIVENRAWIRGGAVAAASTRGARFINNVFWRNYSPKGNDIYLAYYQSSIKHAAKISVEHCLWQGGDEGGVVEDGCELAASANLEENPILANPEGGDYRLTDASPCVDRGQADAAPPEDIEGVKRPQGAGIDIGAFEHTFGEDRP